MHDRIVKITQVIGLQVQPIKRCAIHKRVWMNEADVVMTEIQGTHWRNLLEHIETKFCEVIMLKVQLPEYWPRLY
jgi:hypothetical protein